MQEPAHRWTSCTSSSLTRLPDRPPAERGRPVDSWQRALGRAGMPRARSSPELTRAGSIASSTRPFTAGPGPSCVRRRLPADQGDFAGFAVSWGVIGPKCGARQRRGSGAARRRADVARRSARRPPAETGSLFDVHHSSGGRRGLVNAIARCIGWLVGAARRWAGECAAGGGGGGEGGDAGGGGGDRWSDWRGPGPSVGWCRFACRDGGWVGQGRTQTVQRSRRW